MKTQTQAAVSSAVPASGGERRWLLLTHQIPPRPSYLRVKVSRQLRRIGAIALKNSVYALPPSEESREDFEWLCREIERAGGETTLCLASFLDEATDERIVAAFRDTREARYRAIARAARDLYLRLEEELMKGTTSAARLDSRKLARRLGAVTATDFFEAPGRQEAERAIAEAEALARRRRSEEEPPLRSPEAHERPAGSPATLPTGRTWVTREGIKVDRMASAWLIRRFIDPAATFKFVAPRGYSPEPSEVRFDMFDGEYTHEGDRCTFETLIERFGLARPALVALGEIVHDVDCKDDKYGRSEARGIAALIDGITRTCERDADRLPRGAALFESLYEHFASR